MRGTIVIASTLPIPTMNIIKRVSKIGVLVSKSYKLHLAFSKCAISPPQANDEVVVFDFGFSFQISYSGLVSNSIRFGIFGLCMSYSNTKLNMLL